MIVIVWIIAIFPVVAVPILLGAFIHWKEIALALTRQLQLAKAQGEVILTADVQPGWARIVLAVRSAMLAVPGKLRLTMPHLTAQDIERIGKAIRDGLVAAAMTDTAPPVED